MPRRSNAFTIRTARKGAIAALRLATAANTTAFFLHLRPVEHVHRVPTPAQATAIRAVELAENTVTYNLREFQRLSLDYAGASKRLRELEDIRASLIRVVAGGTL
jgi:histidinol-phosphate/aromatic aminotransferase/cobyric acid decarboxylase-like protein